MRLHGRSGPRPDPLTAPAGATQPESVTPHRRPLQRLPGVFVTSVALVRRASPRLAAVVVVVQVLVAVLAVSQLAALQRALSAILTGGESGDYAAIVPPLSILAALIAVGGVLNAALSQFRRLLGQRVNALVLDRIFGVTVAVDLEDYEQPEFFNRLQRVVTNASSRPLALTQGLIDLVASSLTTIGVSVALFVLHPLLLPLLLVPAIPLFLLSRRASRSEYDFVLAQTPAHRERAYVMDVLTGRDGAKEVRAFGLGRAMRERNAALVHRYDSDLQCQVSTRIRLAIASSLLSSIALVLTIVVIVVLLQRGELSVADAGVAAVAVRLLGGRVESTFSAAGAMLESSLFLEDLSSFLRLAEERRQHQSGSSGGAPLPALASLRLERVCFRYPGTDEDVLHDVDLELRAGEVVALVGENGSGKTTLAKVIAGLYTPTGGRVLWNDEAIDHYALVDRRQQMAVIFQDFVRYGFPARDNVALGRPDDPVDDAAVREATRRVGIDDVLQGLPHGYDTYLSRLFDGGRDLSLGQWQRLAIARALYRNAPLLVLDEPSASLDARAEQAMFDQVRSVLAERTALLISHRFATVRTADRIYVLEGGRVTESGTHAELVRVGGHYAELYDLQARSFR